MQKKWESIYLLNNTRCFIRSVNQWYSFLTFYNNEDIETLSGLTLICVECDYITRRVYTVLKISWRNGTFCQLHYELHWLFQCCLNTDVVNFKICTCFSYFTGNALKILLEYLSYCQKTLPNLNIRVKSAK